MDATDIAARVARQHLRAAGLSPSSGPVVVADSAAVTINDIERELADLGLVVRNVLLFAVPDLDGVEVVRWTATDADGELVRGTVAVQVQQDVHQVSVRLAIWVLSGTMGPKARA